MTREDILARMARRDEIAGQIEQLQQRLQAEDKWLEALKLILPASFLSDVFSSDSPNNGSAERSSVWRDAVLSALGAADRGMLPKDIGTFIRENGSADARERIHSNPNGLYNMLGKLIDDGRAIKVGDKFYSSDLHAKLSQSGELDEDASSENFDAIKAAFLEVFAKHGPMVPKSVIEFLRRHPDVGPKIEANPQYPYGTLVRLVRQKHLVKDGSFYALPSQWEGKGDGGQARLDIAADSSAS